MSLRTPCQSYSSWTQSALLDPISQYHCPPPPSPFPPTYCVFTTILWGSSLNSASLKKKSLCRIISRTLFIGFNLMCLLHRIWMVAGPPSPMRLCDPVWILSHRLKDHQGLSSHLGLLWSLFCCAVAVLLVISSWNYATSQSPGLEESLVFVNILINQYVKYCSVLFMVWFNCSDFATTKN